MGEPGAKGQEVGVVTEGSDAVVTARKVPFPGAFGHRPRFAGRDLAWTSCRMGLSGGRRTGMALGTSDPLEDRFQVASEVGVVEGSQRVDCQMERGGRELAFLEEVQ